MCHYSYFFFTWNIRTMTHKSRSRVSGFLFLLLLCYLWRPAVCNWGIIHFNNMYCWTCLCQYPAPEQYKYSCIVSSRGNCNNSLQRMHKLCINNFPLHLHWRWAGKRYIEVICRSVQHPGLKRKIRKLCFFRNNCNFMWVSWCILFLSLSSDLFFPVHLFFVDKDNACTSLCY